MLNWKVRFIWYFQSHISISSVLVFKLNLKLTWFERMLLGLVCWDLVWPTALSIVYFSKHLSLALPVRWENDHHWGPIHTGRGTRCAMRRKKTGPVDVNRSVHTARKHHQRKKVRIWARLAPRVLCAALPDQKKDSGLNTASFWVRNLLICILNAQRTRLADQRTPRSQPVTDDGQKLSEKATKCHSTNRPIEQWTHCVHRDTIVWLSRLQLFVQGCWRFLWNLEGDKWISLTHWLKVTWAKCLSYNRVKGMVESGTSMNLCCSLKWKWWKTTVLKVFRESPQFDQAGFVQHQCLTNTSGAQVQEKGTRIVLSQKTVAWKIPIFNQGAVQRHCGCDVPHDQSLENMTPPPSCGEWRTTWPL